MNTHFLFRLIIILLLTGCQSDFTQNQSNKTKSPKNQISSENKTLYSELGGEKSINIATISMVKKLHADDRLGELFSEVDDNELIQNFNDFICQLTGGGCEYHGATMEDVHAELFISKAEFDRFVSLFIFSMQEANISFTAQNKLLAKLAGLRGEVIEL